MSAPELTPVDTAMHDILRRAITQAVLNEAPKNHYFAKLSEGEKIEVRKRLLTLSNMHVIVRDGVKCEGDLLDLTRLRGWFLDYVNQIYSTVTHLPLSSLETCQVVNSTVREAYPCGHRESGDLICEAFGDPSLHDHMISEHTTLHDLRGNGYSCESIDAALIARRNEQDGAAR